MNKSKKNTVIIYYANGTRKVISFLSQSGIPQIAFEGLKGLGIMAVFVIEADAGAECSGAIAPLFGIISKTSTRLTLSLSVATAGITLEALHQAFRLLPKGLKSPVSIWIDNKAEEYRIAVYEGLYSASLTFSFVNGILQQVFGPTFATTASLISGISTMGWTVLTYNPYIGITPTQLRELRQKVMADSKTSSLTKKIEERIINALPNLPDSCTRIVNTIEPYASFLKAIFQQIKHSASIGMWAAFDINLIRVCFYMAFIDNPALFYALSIIAFGTITVSHPFLDQFYLTKRQADRIGPNASTTSKHQILKKASNAWKKETLFYTSIIKFLEDAARTGLGTAFLAVAIFEIRDAINGYDIDTSSYENSALQIDNWILILQFIVTLFISLSNTSTHILSFSDESKAIKAARNKLRSQEIEDEKDSDYYMDDEITDKDKTKRPVESLRDKGTSTYNYIRNTLGSLPIFDQFISPQQSACVQEIQIEADEENPNDIELQDLLRKHGENEILSTPQPPRKQTTAFYKTVKIEESSLTNSLLTADSLATALPSDFSASSNSTPSSSPETSTQNIYVPPSPTSSDDNLEKVEIDHILESSIEEEDTDISSSSLELFEIS